MKEKNDMIKIENKKFIELLDNKREKLITEEDVEKYNVILELLKRENCFFDISFETAIGIF